MEQDKINIPTPNADAPKHPLSVECGCCCGAGNAPNYKKKCFFYDGLQDMGATIPFCSYFSKMEIFSCKDCGKFISKAAAFEIIKNTVENN